MWEIVLHCLCIICLQSTLHTHAKSHSRAPFGHASIYSPHFSGDFGKFFVPLQLDSVDPWNKLWPFPLEILFAHFDWLYPKSIPIGACMPCAPCALADWPVSPWAAPLSPSAAPSRQLIICFLRSKICPTAQIVAAEAMNCSRKIVPKHFLHKN